LRKSLLCSIDREILWFALFDSVLSVTAVFSRR
jgi:hypothetical protein